MATPEQINAAREGLRAANVVHVYSAARAAGLSFRNGPSKFEVINLLERNVSMLLAAWANVQRQQGGEPSQPEPQAPTQAPSTPVVPSQPSQPAPPSNYKAQAPSEPASDPSALVAALRAAIGATPIDAEQVKTIAQQVTEEALSQFEVDAAGLEFQIGQMVTDAVSKLPQGTVIHLPEKTEPVKFEGTQHYQFGDLLLCLRAELNVMLCGPASSGKTYSAHQAAIALGLDFHAQGAVSYAHELLGYIDAHGKYVTTEFRKAYEQGGLILLDEFDASSAEAPLVINAALANGFCAFPDGMIQKHPSFLCVTGTNTDGSGATMQYSGRARLDGAFLDRFVKIDWQIDPAIEKGKAAQFGNWLSAVREVRQWIESRQIHDVAATVRAVDHGARLLALKMPAGKVAELTLKRGALAGEWSTICKLPAMAEFLTGF